MMINHARTVLLNPQGTRVPPGESGEEYIPEGYRYRELPRTLSSVRKEFLGIAPDTAYENTMLRIIMTAMHGEATVKKYIEELDPRFTYLGRRKPILSQASAHADQSAGKGKLLVRTMPEADDLIGTMIFMYRVTASEAGVRIDNLNTNKYVDYPPGKKKIVTDSMSFDLTGLGTWDVVAKAQPKRDLAMMAENLRKVPGTVDALFNIVPPQYAMFRRLWDDGNTVAAQVAGLAAAWVAAAETL